MKKNLFLLFSLYFFVGQPIIVGFLRQEPLMFVLAVINLIAILLITLLYGIRWHHDDQADHEDKAKAKKVMHEVKSDANEPHHYEAPHAKKNKKGSSVGPALISIILAFVLYLFTAGAEMGIRLLMAGIVWIILFIIFALIFWSNKKFSIFYIIVLIFGVLIAAYQYTFQTVAVPYGLGQYLAVNIHATKLWGGQTAVLGQDQYYLTGEWTVLGSGLENTQVTGDLATIFSGIQGSDVVSGNTEVVVNTWTTQPPVTTPSWKSLTMLDMIKSLLAKYNIPLVTTTNVGFTYMSKTSPDYTYFRTAYSLKLIGSTTNPTKLGLCDTYIVMKWILEKWNITYTPATVMQKYRAYAQAQGVLNGCEKGKVVKENNL